MLDKGMAIAKLPKSWFVPRPQPLDPAIAKSNPFSTSISTTPLFMYQLGLCGTTTMPSPHHLCTRQDGSQHTDNIQGYTPDYYKTYYQNPNLDGERGIATFYSGTQCIPGRKDKMYGHSYTSFFRTNADGKKITRFGAYHKYAPDYREAKEEGPEELYAGTTSDPRLMGPKNHRLIGAWGGDWDWKTLGLSTTLPMIGTENVHGDDNKPLDPDWHLTDERGYWIRLRSDGQDPNRNDPDHTKWAPVDGVVMLEGLNVPRGLAHRRGTREAFIAETGGNCITRVNLDTGVIIDKLIDNNAQASAFGYTPKLGVALPIYRRFTPYSGANNAITLRANSTAAAIQCFAPEGLVYYTDKDGEWLAWVNRALLQIVRMNINTKVHQVVGNLHPSPSSDPGNQVASLAVNDNLFVDSEGNLPRGGFGVHGTLFAIDFFHAQNGYPWIYEPQSDGTFKGVSVASNYSYDTMWGRGPGWSNYSYTTGIGVGYNKLYLMSALGGCRGYS